MHFILKLEQIDHFVYFFLHIRFSMYASHANNNYKQYFDYNNSIIFLKPHSTLTSSTANYLSHAISFRHVINRVVCVNVFHVSFPRKLFSITKTESFIFIIRGTFRWKQLHTKVSRISKTE